MGSGLRYKGPLNPDPKDGEAGIIIYGYVPSLGLAIVGVITFATLLAVNVYYLVKRKGKGNRSFHSLYAVGSLMEMGGYAARIASHGRPFVVGSFVAQYFLIVVAPVLFTAGIYLSLSMAVEGFANADHLLIISPRLVLAFFITADVVTTIIQIAGAALIGTSESSIVQNKVPAVTPQQANNILLAGLAIQTFSFVCFIAILLVALYRVQQDRTVALAGNTNLRRYLNVILVTSLLILLRTTYRLGETAEGFFGPASTSEALFGCLEYLPVIVALIVWAALPPSRFIPPDDGPIHEKQDPAIAERQA